MNSVRDGARQRICMQEVGPHNCPARIGRRLGQKASPAQR